jgi:hypothetical protein
MDQSINQAFDTPEVDHQSGKENHLWQYVNTLDAPTVARLSKPNSPEVQQVMERHIISLLGALPAENFEVMITTDRENLGRMMAAAMLHGYFLKTVEQRLAFETSLLGAGFASESSESEIQ